MQKITIPQGLFGFEDRKNYTLSESDYDPFMWLQSDEEKALAFLVVDPFVFRPDYEIDVDDSSLADIGISDPSDVIVMVIVTIPGNGQPITANLQGPLVINKKNGKAKQIVLADQKWCTKHDILAESKQMEKVC
ncbi:MAG: flagellar assembly protein FliW [Treponemataceae bacterium]|nr:flagellar assembly protein FliW [Treponemataceae bacterium]